MTRLPLPAPPEPPDLEDEAGAAREYTTPHHHTWFARVLADLRRALSPAMPPPLPPGTPAPARSTWARLGGPGWVLPMEGHAVISDGWHAKGDMRFRNGAGHRGADFMERKAITLPRGAPLDHPWESRGYRVRPGTRALAAGPGRVTVARWLRTGWAVCIDHCLGVETAYHHLAELRCKVGTIVRAGDAIGVVGGAPPAKPGGKPGLVHLHFDLLVHGRFIDPEPYTKTWPRAALAT